MTCGSNGGQDKGDGVFVGKEGTRENPIACRSNGGQDKGDGVFVGKEGTRDEHDESQWHATVGRWKKGPHAGQELGKEEIKCLAGKEREWPWQQRQGATQNYPPQDQDPMQKQNLRQQKAAKRQNPPWLQDGYQWQRRVGWQEAWY
jgi:hypothetical protein